MKNVLRYPLLLLNVIIFSTGLVWAWQANPQPPTPPPDAKPDLTAEVRQLRGEVKRLSRELERTNLRFEQFKIEIEIATLTHRLDETRSDLERLALNQTQPEETLKEIDKELATEAEAERRDLLQKERLEVQETLAQQKSEKHRLAEIVATLSQQLSELQTKLAAINNKLS